MDETWCLFDRQLIDDELYKLLGEFAAGVRILVLSDSWHSGTVTKNAFMKALQATGALDALSADGVRGAPKAMPISVAGPVYQRNRTVYEPILRAADPQAEAKVKASVLLISGCQDNQLSEDGAFNGRFTGELLRVWKGGLFKGSHRDFHEAIRGRMPPHQTPNFFAVGAPNPVFEAHRPFTL